MENKEMIIDSESTNLVAQINEAERIGYENSLQLEARSIVDDMENGGQSLYASFNCDSVQDKIKLYNATSGDTVALKSYLNKIIQMTDVVVMGVILRNEDGTQSTSPRVCIIDKDGKYYASTSWGVYNSLRKIQSIFGTLHFEDPIKISPVEVKTKNGFTINIKLV